MPFMTRLRVSDSWTDWDIAGEKTEPIASLWCYEGVAYTHIILSGLRFLAAVWHWIYWDLELFRDPRTG